MMKYFFDILLDVMKDKELVQIKDLDNFGKYIDENGIDKNEILFYHKKIILNQDELVKSKWSYILSENDCDFMGNMKVNGQTNFQFTYSNLYNLVRIDNQHNMYLTNPHSSACPLVVDLRGHQQLNKKGDSTYVEIEYDCYLVVDSKSRKELITAPMLITNVNKKIIALVDANYHGSSCICIFNSLEDIKNYYKQLNWSVSNCKTDMLRALNRAGIDLQECDNSKVKELIKFWSRNSE